VFGLCGIGEFVPWVCLVVCDFYFVVGLLWYLYLIGVDLLMGRKEVFEVLGASEQVRTIDNG